jgi:ABC-2 type transport system ATP-binding protein
MGQNGSGKSTLFKLLTGMAQPEKGSVEWLGDGHVIGSGMVATAQTRSKIAYVPDELDIPDMSWSLYAWKEFVSGLYPDWNGPKYRRLVERYNLDENKSMRRSSKGSRRKAALVIALSQEPQVLLVDEPSAGLDPFAWKMMLEDFAEFMASGDKTILMATHIMEEIRRLGDYICFVHEGQLFGPYEKDALMDSWRMLWVDGLPGTAHRLPGVVAVEQQLPVRLITNAPKETEAALEELGLAIVNQRALEWDELFWHVIRTKDRSIY